MLRRLLSARARGVELGDHGGALCGDVVAGVLREEALGHQCLLALQQPALLRGDGLEAAYFGLVGAILQYHVALVDDRHHGAGLDHRSGAGKHLRDPAGDFGTNLGISQDFERAERFLGGLEFARGDLGHGDLRGRWSGPRLLRGWFAAGGKKEGQKQSEEERGTHRGTFHGRSDSLANSSAMVSRRRIRCIRSPSTMTSAARGRVL